MKTPEELEKLAAESGANDNHQNDMTDDEKYHHRRGFIFGFQKAERLLSETKTGNGVAEYELLEQLLDLGGAMEFACSDAERDSIRSKAKVINDSVYNKALEDLKTRVEIIQYNSAEGEDDEWDALQSVLEEIEILKLKK